MHRGGMLPGQRTRRLRDMSWQRLPAQQTADFGIQRARYRGHGGGDLPERPQRLVFNLEYTLPSGQNVKLLDDDTIYLGNQICKTGSGRCYGLAADERCLLVCEYGDGGSDAEIVVYKRRNR